jgi:hypothetical protein
MIKKTTNGYLSKAKCDICGKNHMGTQSHCELKAKTPTSNSNRLDVNLIEHAKTVTLGNVYDTMEYERSLILGVLFMPPS